MLLDKLKVNRKVREEGFSLLELVIVILILGILVAIAVPVYSNQQKQAHISTLKSDVTSTAASLASWQQTQDYNANPSLTVFNSQIVRQSDPANIITLTVYNSADPNNIEFCIQGARQFSTTETVTWNYSTVSKQLTEGVCVPSPAQAPENLDNNLPAS